MVPILEFWWFIFTMILRVFLEDMAIISGILIVLFLVAFAIFIVLRIIARKRYKGSFYNLFLDISEVVLNVFP